jgi:hypothetical protein
MKTKAERDPELVCKHEGCGAYHMAQSEFCYGHDLEYRKAKRENKKFHGNIIEAFENPSFFGSLIQDQSTWTNWKIILKAIFHTVDYLPKAEMEIFTELTGRKKWSTRKFREVFIAAGRRSGKSFISALLAVYLALFKDWSRYLQQGEVGHIMIIASDRSQAQIIMGYVRAVFDLPKFTDEVKKVLREDIVLKNGLTISVKTCSISSVRGWTCPVILCDEIAFWKNKETGANPDKSVLASLRPTQATIKDDSLLLCLSSPYSRSGVLYEAHSKYFGKDDKNTLVVQAPSIRLNPTLDQEWIDEQLENDYEQNKAEYLAIFRDDVSSFLPAEVIENAIIWGRKNLPPQKDVRYYAFADSSSGSKVGESSFALCISHLSKEKIIVDFTIEKIPPFKPKSVVAEMCTYLKNYGIKQVTGDKWALGFVSAEFEANGIRYINCKLSTSEIYLEFAPALIQGQVELPDNQKLIAQLRGLERRIGYQKDSVAHAGRDDIANAVAGVVTQLIGYPDAPLTEAELNARLPQVASQDDSEKIMQEFLSDGGKKRLSMFVKKGR